MIQVEVVCFSPCTQGGDMAARSASKGPRAIASHQLQKKCQLHSAPGIITAPSDNTAPK